MMTRIKTIENKLKNEQYYSKYLTGSLTTAMSLDTTMKYENKFHLSEQRNCIVFAQQNQAVVKLQERLRTLIRVSLIMINQTRRHHKKRHIKINNTAEISWSKHSKRQAKETPPLDKTLWCGLIFVFQWLSFHAHKHLYILYNLIPLKIVGVIGSL